MKFGSDIHGPLRMNDNDAGGAEQSFVSYVSS